jgi:hypothetical protein
MGSVSTHGAYTITGINYLYKDTNGLCLVSTGVNGNVDYCLPQ